MYNLCMYVYIYINSMTLTVILRTAQQSTWFVRVVSFSHPTIQFVVSWITWKVFFLLCNSGNSYWNMQLQQNLGIGADMGELSIVIFTQASQSPQVHGLFLCFDAEYFNKCEPQPTRQTKRNGSLEVQTQNIIWTHVRVCVPVYVWVCVCVCSHEHDTQSSLSVIPVINHPW